MALPIDPNMLAGILPQLGNLGIGIDKAVGQTVTNDSNVKGFVDSAIQAWRSRQEQNLKKIGEAGPKPQGSQGAALGGILAAILAGAGGGGAEGVSAAQEGGQNLGAGLIAEKNQNAQAQWQQGLQSAVEDMKLMNDTSKGVRMLLQSQPQLFKGDMQRLASEIAFGPSGLEATTLEEAQNGGVKNMIDAIDFLITKGGIEDPTTLAQLNKMRFGLATGMDVQLDASNIVDPSLGIDPDKLLRDAINGKELVTRWQQTGVPPLAKDIMWRPHIINKYDNEELDALKMWGQLQAPKEMGGQELTARMALQQIENDRPDLYIRITKRWGQAALGGGLDLETAGRIAMQGYMKLDEEARVADKALFQSGYFDKKIAEYYTYYEHQATINALDDMTKLAAQEAEKLAAQRGHPGVLPEDTDDAWKSIKARYASTFRNMNQDAVAKYFSTEER